MRWNKRFDGTKESIEDKSHRPHKKHPNAHTDEEILIFLFVSFTVNFAQIKATAIILVIYIEPVASLVTIQKLHLLKKFVNTMVNTILQTN